LSAEVTWERVTSASRFRRYLMLEVLTPSAVQANASSFVRYVDRSVRDATRDDLLFALNKVQAHRVPFRAGERDPSLSFGTTPEEEALLRFIAIPETLASEWRYAPDEQAALRQRVRAAHDLLESYDRELAGTIGFLIGAYVCGKVGPRFSGGSVSKAIGAIWLGLDAASPAVEVADLILHEFVHNALFLDDMVRGSFRGGEGALDKKEYRVTSAILQIPRGYDKAFHSAYVAATLADFHLRRGDAARARTLLEPALVTIRELATPERRHQVLKANGQLRLEQLRHFGHDLSQRLS
jgi:hypothetical protein